jgi:hypothetical protein
MKVSKEVFELSEKILDTFDPVRIKNKEMVKIEEKERHLQNRLE